MATLAVEVEVLDQKTLRFHLQDVQLATVVVNHAVARENISPEYLRLLVHGPSKDLWEGLTPVGQQLIYAVLHSVGHGAAARVGFSCFDLTFVMAPNWRIVVTTVLGCISSRLKRLVTVEEREGIHGLPTWLSPLFAQ
jgi:hypothetical protein